MNTFEDKIKFSKKSMSEIGEIYSTYTKRERKIKNYSDVLLTQRESMINWIIFLCDNLSFKRETMYRAITLYDLYLSESFNFMDISFDQLKLTAIACLSLATKLEEINCNYIEFLTSNVLNSQEEQNYSSKDLVLKEMEILKELKFFSNQTTAFQFLSLFQQICFNVLGDCSEFKQIVDLTNSNLETFILSNQSISYSPKQIAYFVFKQVFTFISQSIIQTQSETQKLNNFSLSKILLSVFELLNTEKKKFNYVKSDIYTPPCKFALSQNY
ncbi:MAG: cyclin [archaeon]|nr:cyclin [archaeon]